MEVVHLKAMNLTNYIRWLEKKNKYHTFIDRIENVNLSYTIKLKHSIKIKLISMSKFESNKVYSAISWVESDCYNQFSSNPKIKKRVNHQPRPYGPKPGWRVGPKSALSGRSTWSHQRSLVYPLNPFYVCYEKDIFHQFEFWLSKDFETYDGGTVY